MERRLTRGATLFLPVQTDGGLFSTGDGHAAEKDGEVCSGMETSMVVTLRFRLLKGRPLLAERPIEDPRHAAAPIHAS